VESAATHAEPRRYDAGGLREIGAREPRRARHPGAEGEDHADHPRRATNYHAAENDEVPSGAPQGSYSFVLLRWLVDGKVRSRVLEGEFYPKKATFNAPNRYRVGGVYDLDGDGRMEVVVESAYYEGGATTVYRCTPAKIEKVLEIACGV
jgi:hypothetical protein